MTPRHEADRFECVVFVATCRIAATAASILIEVGADQGAGSRIARR
jgi:hypothetical protein